MTERNKLLSATLPDVEGAERTSGTYLRPTSATLESKAALVRELAAQVRAGELSPQRIAASLELLAQGIDIDAGSVLALEAKS